MPAMKTTQQMRDELLLAGGGAVKAPVTPTGFYSPLEEAALNIQRKAGNAQAFMNDLRTVPKEHLQHAGVDKLLTSRPTITREELQQHIARAAPKVEVKVMGGGRGLPPILSDYFENTTVQQPTTTEGWIAEAVRQERKARQFQAQGNDRLANRLFELAEAMNQHAESGETGASATKYSKYTLPGGQNYREVLLTLPQQKPRMNYRVYAQGPVEQLPEVLDFDSQEKAEAELARRRVAQPRLEHGMMEFEKLPRDGGIATYRSSHWDEPNVLAHFRINDRTDKDGKKVLFVEEIQSDWGQEGKKEGFADPNKKPVSQKEFNAYIDGLLDDYVARQVRAGVSRDEATDRGIRMQLPEMAQALGRADEYARMRAGRDMDMSGTTGVPSAPFVTKTNDWVNLALKHILKTAAEEGHDRVAFVRGEQAADRFGLDKHFSRIQAKPVPGGGFELHTTAKDGRRESSVNVPPQKLKDYVGEEFANKIQQQGGGVFEGDDLRVPNTGMRKFYDELVPAQAQGLIKRFGGQMGTVQVPLEPKGLSWPSAPQKYSEHPGFDITPEMRQAILKPMSYKVGGAVPAMDAMRLQVWDKRRGR